MANSNRPDGLTPWGPILRITRYFKDATSAALGVGDPVIRGTDSSDPNGYPEVVRHVADAAVTGVVIGVEPIRSNLNQRYLAAADIGYVLVADHPLQKFVVQDNGGATGIVVTNIGQHVDTITAVDCNTITGRSKITLDTEAIATGNTWRIEGQADMTGNDVGQYCRWIVCPNLHTDTNASATNLTEI